MMSKNNDELNTPFLSEDAELLKALGRLEALYLYDPPRALRELDALKQRFPHRTELHSWEDKLERYRLLLEEEAQESDSSALKSSSTAPPTGEFVFSPSNLSPLTPSEEVAPPPLHPPNERLAQMNTIREEVPGKLTQDWQQVFHFLEKFDLYRPNSSSNQWSSSPSTQTGSIPSPPKPLPPSHQKPRPRNPNNLAGYWDLWEIAENLYQLQAAQEKVPEVLPSSSSDSDEQWNSFEDLPESNAIGFWPVFIFGILVGIFLVISLVLWHP